MSTTSATSRKRMGWRLLAVGTVASAIGLGVLGVSVALRQVQAVTARLMSQAHLRARQVAATAEARYAGQREHLLRVLRAEGCPRPGASTASSAALPVWVDGLFAWDGSEIEVLVAPSDTVGAITARVKRTLVDASVAASAERATPEHTGTVEAPSFRLTLITVECSGLGAKPMTLAAHVHQNRLLAELIDPLLEHDDGLELVSSKDSAGLWSHALSGPLRGWSLQPSAAFVQEQQTLVFGQTLTYIALTALALIALLIAMWFLARAARRDMALAELKSNFVADVSHELKTPLSVIRLYAETLQSGRPLSEEKRRGYYSIIERESTRLTNLINNILDFARIEAGRRAYRMEPTDIASVVRDTYRAYRAELDHQGFQHSLTVVDSLPSVKADGDAIGQALLNLLSNAVKYSADEKYIAISVTMDTRRDRQGVVISVEDHGIGIQPADRARVFEGFFRAGDGRVQRQGGTGLGLALVKHIVDAHGGMLLVESRLVKGTAFRIFLPVSR